MVLPSERLQRAQRMLAFDAAGPQHASVEGSRSTRATRGQAAPRYDPSAVDVPLHPRTVDGPEGEEEEEEDAAALGEDDELFGRHSEGPEHRAVSGAPLDDDSHAVSAADERASVLFQECLRIKGPIGWEAAKVLLRDAAVYENDSSGKSP